eukprot:6237176-Prymnesium_polylepis.1
MLPGELVPRCRFLAEARCNLGSHRPLSFPPAVDMLLHRMRHCRSRWGVSGGFRLLEHGKLCPALSR